MAAVGETEVQAYPFESIFVGTAPDRAVTVKDRDTDGGRHRNRTIPL